LEQTSLS